ncbi:polyamine aminopropyltransferase [Chloropicon roscoffensis]|uniref:thermospermine synthase n=1 Tax=Chloropicon roscoffensis TaxID=1461544 RepID=A0AAX4NZ00_9CHLO
MKEEKGASLMGAKRLWLEEEIQDDLRWLYSVKSILHAEVSDFQDVELLETGPFGKVLLLDGKLQSAEADERVYHECLVHPALLHHPNPKKVFICGGGEGSTAREVLKHKSVEKVVMVDIDKVVCDFCEKHLEDNADTFKDARLELIIDDAKAQLENQRDGEFDVIIGDLADPVFGGPCYQLYTREFYENIVKAKLAPGGVFVTQSGPAGVLAHTEVFTPINRTLASVFPRVVPYLQHIPSFADCWGWNMAFKDGSEQAPLEAAQLDKRIEARVAEGSGALAFMDGLAWVGITSLNKIVRKSLEGEKHVLTIDSPKFIHGQGVKQVGF